MLKLSNYTLRTAVIVPFILVLLVTIGIVTWVQKSSYESTLKTLSQRQLNSIAKGIDLGLTSFLDEPFKVNLRLSDTIATLQKDYVKANGQLDFPAAEQILKQNFQRLLPSVEQIDSISIGTPEGKYIGFRQNDDKSTSLMLKDPRTNDQLTIFRGDNVESQIISRIQGYSPLNRPWYQSSASIQKPSWSDLYTNIDDLQYLNMSASAPIIIDDQLYGVLASDIRLSTFHTFLDRLQQQTQARIIIFDQSNKLIAQSNSESLFYTKNQQQHRNNIIDIEDPVLHQLAENFINKNLTSETEGEFSFDLNGESYFNFIYPYKNNHNLSWTIAVTLPESAILGDIEKRQTHALFLVALIALIVMLGVFIGFTRITRPIRETAAAAHKISQGNWDAKMPALGRIDEINSMVHSFNDMTTTLRRSFDTLREQITYDSLTRLYSRQGFIDAVTARRLENNTQIGSFLICSVERFRDINDTLGHFRGDKVLMIMAERLKSLLHAENILARINGDEFIIYIPHPSRSFHINQLIDSIKKTFQAPIKVGTEEVLIHVVMGISSTEDAEDINQWMHNTSIALNHAKSDPRRMMYYTSEMASDSFKRTQTIVRINRALESREFVPYYQPLVELETGRVIGAEALARWICPENGLIPPLEFIPIAEEYGQISFIGQQVLHTACQDTKNQIDAGLWPEDFHLHVNISVHQLSMPSFTQTVADILAQTKLPPKNLTLEVTESHIVDNDPVLLENMTRIRRLGVGIAIDDFGTGYSSLAYLHKMPFDCLKIDRCFIDNLKKETLETSVVASILQMTSTLNIEIVAEGIETKEQAELLNALHCKQAQGFYYARPVPLNEWPLTKVLPLDKRA